MTTSATLRAVAELAGVSMGTASQALNGKPHVAPETRAKVLEAARSAGYVVKDLPPAVDKEALALVGMLTKYDMGLTAAPNPFYTHIQAGIEAECRRRGIKLMLAHLEVDQRNHPIAWPAMIRESAVEGLLLLGAFIEDTVDQINRQLGHMPIVLIDGYAPTLPLDSVVTDNHNGAAQIVQHLIELGHTHIGLIGWHDESPPSIHERHEGYRSALRQQGLPETYVEPSRLNRENGAAALQRLLRRAPEVTAIFACNDDCAIGVLQAARSLGLLVPQDLSVVGFDDIDQARDLTPALTTVHIPKGWMGALGLRQLLARTREPDMPKITTRLAAQPVIRASSGVVRKELVLRT